MSTRAFITDLQRHRTSAIIRSERQSVAAQAMDAAVRGGIRIVEFTLTTPGAEALITEFSERGSLPEVDGLDRLWVGAGTVLTVNQAKRAVAAGARFLVSPVVDPKIIAAANDMNVAVIPGVHTPSEMVAAHRAGAPLLKLFPAPAGGPAWLRSALAPLPFLRVVPTNGVDETNIVDWLQAGAVGVGLVAALFRPADLACGHFDAIEARAAAMRRAAATVEHGRASAAVDPFA